MKTEIQTQSIDEADLETKAAKGTEEAPKADEAPKKARRPASETVITLDAGEALDLAQTRMQRAREIQEAFLRGEEADLNAQYDAMRQAQGLLGLSAPGGAVEIVVRVYR